MLFDSLDKIRRNSIMSAILLTALGFIILVCPNDYIGSLIMVLGYALEVIGIVMMLNFFSSNKSLMDYIKFVGALILIIVGISVLIYQDDIMHTLAWLFGLLLVLDGGRTLFHSFTYARRSERKGWWVLTILSILLMIAGIALFVNPWWNTKESLTNVVGGTVLSSALISLIRLFWTWPLKKSKGGDKNGR